MSFFLFFLGRAQEPVGRGALQNAHVTYTHLYSPTPPPIMFEQHISSDIFFHREDNKIVSGNLYLRQPHTVIQLVEVASPPPRRISSVINSSSAASSSYTSSSSSSFEQDQEEEEDEDEDESASSYCSSDDDLPPPIDEIEMSLSPRTPQDTLSGRMKRILLWREQSPHLISGIFTVSMIDCLLFFSF